MKCIYLKITGFLKQTFPKFHETQGMNKVIKKLTVDIVTLKEDVWLFSSGNVTTCTSKFKEITIDKL
jgi:hypothetical protein